MTELTFGFFKHHAMESCAVEHPRSAAIGESFLKQNQK